MPGGGKYHGSTTPVTWDTKVRWDISIFLVHVNSAKKCNSSLIGQ